MPKPPAPGQRVRSTALKDPSKGRISPKLRDAITSMVTQGLSRKEAAEKAGLTDHALYCALCKPHVMQFKNGVLRAFRSGAAEKSFVNVVNLADDAKSENVKLEANKTILSMDDRFLMKTQVNQVHSGEVKVTPGYVIDLSDTPHQMNDLVIEAEFTQVSE